MAEIEVNSQFRQVLDFIDKTSRSIFLTGKAGTGKTTLLRHIRSATYKQIAVCAPTGVAAINAGGTTIHSFFQFPFTPFIPALKENGDIDASGKNLPTLKYNSQRLAIFRSLELLVIDEVSMVRADLLDQIDITLRHTRRKWQQPFGGVQVLLIGDMHQLPPVVQPNEWSLLAPHYRSPYFFDSHVITQHKPVHIELTKVYRQSDQEFIDLLNKVRHNELDSDAHAVLNQRFQPDLKVSDYNTCVTLTTHNRKADEINDRHLADLPGKPHVFKAEVEGLFSEKSYPAAEQLELKPGARVMFLKNNYEKNYYNGKTGIVEAIDGRDVTVRCDEDDEIVNVVPETWSNMSYKVEKSSHHIREEVLGTFTQLPLRPAWAITIHKSQGLTFDKVIIDAAEAFSAGQVYVALSRCRSLGGLTLSTRIQQESLKNDEQVLTFSAGRHDEKTLGSIFEEARVSHLRALLFDLFDFGSQAGTRRELASLAQEHERRVNAVGHQWLKTLFDALDEMHRVGEKFTRQLREMADQSSDPANETALQERVKKAAEWFATACEKTTAMLKQCPLSIELVEAAGAFNETLQPLFEALHLKAELLKACKNGFSLDGYVAAKLKVEYPSRKINVYATAANTRIANVPHPALLRELLMIRDEICGDGEIPVYMVANAKTITEMANRMPVTPDELLCISGFGKARVAAYGEQFLTAIRAYREQHNISTEFDFGETRRKKKEKVIKETKPRKEPQPNSKEVTMTLFRQGLSPEEIARDRGMAVSTILGHLVPFVEKGEVDIHRLVPADKLETINTKLEGFVLEQGLLHLKNQLPAEISFSDIKFAIAHQARQKVVMEKGE